MPKEHAADIERLLRQLHEINYFSISFPGKPKSALDSIQTLRELLGEDISDAYRAAIHTKIAR